MDAPVTEPPARLGLRDRKKIKLRETLLQTADRMFRENGYEKTTLERICEEAETSLRTLLRYFPTKEDLALGRELIVLEEAAETFAGLDPSVSVIEFWRERMSHTRSDLDKEAFLAHVRLLDSSPSLQAKMLALQVRYEDMLAGAFARQAGVDPENDLHGRLLAGLLISGNRAATRRWAASNGKLDLHRLRMAVIDWAIANFPPRPANAAGKRAG
jgi:AcrR family transcriptional regulator